MVKFVIRKDVYDELLEKGFGKKDISKLTKKQVTDKNGKTRTVYVKNGEEQKDKQKAKPAEEEKPHSYAHTVGDEVEFVSNDGKKLNGVIKTQGKDGCIIEAVDMGLKGSYKVTHQNIKDISKKADGTIPASKFNANDYKKSFTDPKCTNDVKGIEYVYSLLGAEGVETQAMVEKKLYEQLHRLKKR